jgi:hypothetical protein
MTCGSGDLSTASPPETPRAKPKGEKVPASLGKCSWKQVNRAGIMSHGLESNPGLDVNVALLATEVGFICNRRAKAVNTDTVWIPYAPGKELLGGSSPNFSALKRPWIA